MATVAFLVDVGADDVDLGPAVAERLASLGVTSVALYRDRETLCLSHRGLGLRSVVVRHRRRGDRHRAGCPHPPPRDADRASRYRIGEDQCPTRDHKHRPAIVALAGAALALALGTATVAAHEHVVNQGTDQEVEIAGGQNHPQFKVDPATAGFFLSCTLPGYTIPANFGEAWYGLETAHHGPDSAEPGKGDGCYAADASPAGEATTTNPAID